MEMVGSTASTTSSGPRRRRSAPRSVVGCLTCRRRRVKCAVQSMPCDNCKRLELTCSPSFHSNFKSYIPNAGASPQSVETVEEASHSGSGREERQSRRQHDLRAHMPVTTTYPTTAMDGETKLPEDVLVWLSKGLGNGQFDSPPLTHCSAPDLQVEDIVSDLSRQVSGRHTWDSVPSCGSLQVNYELYDDGNDVLSYIDESPAHAALELMPTSQRSYFSLNSPNMSNHGVDGKSYSEVASAFFENYGWSIPSQIPQIYGDSYDDVLHGYETNMPKLLTSKRSSWNPYSYMLTSTHGTPESPLRHGILSWTCSYLSSWEQNPSYSGALYYVSASNAVKALIADLSDSDIRGFSGADDQITGKLYLLLATSFFLSHCDLMLCDYASFHGRLDAIKGFFEKEWENLQGILGSLERRLLIWLAYLDLRSSMFGKQRPRRIDSQGYQKDLLKTLKDLNAFPSLRRLRKGQSYLSECFGDSYPKKEIEEDMLQESSHIKCDDVLSILSSINSFEVWNDDNVQHASTESMVQQLRIVKIQALRSDIARIRADCAVIFNNKSDIGSDTVDRTTFHNMTVTALHLSATILLNRIVEPDRRTDPEAQEAAHQIIRISHCLRKTKYLQTPRSLLWPLPIFIAGIEITDTIYQEWIVSYMTELEHRGTNIRKARSVLEQIIQRQQTEGKRVKAGEVMDDFDAMII